MNIYKLCKTMMIVMGLSSMLSAANLTWTPLMMGDITTFVPYINGNGLSSPIKTVQATYNVDEAVSITVDTPLSGDKDWVGIYPVGASNDWANVIAWNWVGQGNTVLTRDKKPMPAGEYEIRLFFHNSYHDEARYTFTVTDNIYVYGKMGDANVEISVYSQDNDAVVYHPTTWNNTPTPVIFFAPGWHNTTHMSYDTLLRFIASHGYSVIYMPDTGSYASQADKFDSVVNEFANKLDTSKVGILGHSAGGGAVFYLLEHAIDKGYGAQGRFMMSLDGYFAYYMDKVNMQNLTDTNILFMQFGPSGNSTDPRVMLTNYNLLIGDGIDKNYIVLPNDDDHGYPSRQNINIMQGMLKPLDALMEYTFKMQSDTHHTLALEGLGKIDPYTNGYQKVLPIGAYDYNCTYANGYHKGSDGVTPSDIDNCGVPEILPNNGQNYFKKKLILHAHSGGWAPMMAPNLIHRHTEINALPFSGFTVVGNSYTNQIMKRNVSVTYNDIWNELKGLKGLYPNKSNFLLVWMNFPGDLWDDIAWDKVTNNFKILAKVAKDLGFAGITYDNEAYTEACAEFDARKLINYDKDGYFDWKTDENHNKICKEAYKNNTRTFSEHTAKITERFKNIMKGMVSEFPAIDVLYYHSPAEGHVKANKAGKNGRPLITGAGRELGHELTGAMFLGLKQGLSANASLHDMGEDYTLTKKEHFEHAYQWRKYTIASDTMNDDIDTQEHWNIPKNDRKLWAKDVQIGYMVTNYARTDADPEFDTRDKVDLNNMKNTIEHALDTNDEYVIFYSASSSVDDEGRSGVGRIKLDWLQDPNIELVDGTHFGVHPDWMNMMKGIYNSKLK